MQDRTWGAPGAAGMPGAAGPGDALSSRSRGCRDARSRSTRGYASTNISLHRFTGCCQPRHRSCSNPFLPSPSPAGRGSPFPGRKSVVKAAKRRSLSSPARTLVHCRDVYTALLCKPESSWLTTPHALQAQLSRERLREGSRDFG